MTRAALLARMRRLLAEAGIENPALDARLLLLGALGIDAAALVRDAQTPVAEEDSGAAMAMAQRRAGHEPVARILGEREFYGLPFALAPATLEPRPDTERVVDVALGLLKDRARRWRILDLGAGSGAILVALLHHLPASHGIAVDLDPAAAAMTRRNAFRNGVGDRLATLVGNWSQALQGRFDLIVSNPPYIRRGDIDLLEAEVRCHDPRLALDGGADGLDAYRAIIADAPRLLDQGGALLLELGAGQADAVAAIGRAGGFQAEPAVADHGGIARVLLLRPAGMPAA